MGAWRQRVGAESCVETAGSFSVIRRPAHQADSMSMRGVQYGSDSRGVQQNGRGAARPRHAARLAATADDAPRRCCHGCTGIFCSLSVLGFAANSCKLRPERAAVLLLVLMRRCAGLHRISGSRRRDISSRSLHVVYLGRMAFDISCCYRDKPLFLVEIS